MDTVPTLDWSNGVPAVDRDLQNGAGSGTKLVPRDRHRTSHMTADYSPIAFACAIAALLWATLACPKQHRRGDDRSAGRPDDEVQKRGDPRFPSAPDAGSRRGFWVEQPVRTGPVSPTDLANAVAEQLPALRDRCCGDAGEACRGFDGRLLLETDIAPNGAVRRAAVAETSLYDRSFRNCALEWARGWELPRSQMREAETVYVPIRVRIPEHGGAEADAGGR